jgi:hypothetical protein
VEVRVGNNKSRKKNKYLVSHGNRREEGRNLEFMLMRAVKLRHVYAFYNALAMVNILQ